MAKRLSDTARNLIAEVATFNERGEHPAKIDVVGFDGRVSNDTRSYRYKMIDRLIRDGYLVDVRTTARAYALQVTDLGRSVIN